jgi:2'-5' RNA ligase
MPRLFVAVDLPDEVKADLVRLQPRSDRGIRLASPEQMHLTLHFLGESELEPTTAALSGVVAPAFATALKGVGRFGSPRRGFILWAGVRPCAELVALHVAVAQALAPTGYQPEPRPFSPHITLARCKPWASQQLINAYLQRNGGYTSSEFPVADFALYSSEPTPEGSIYRCERRFPLVAATAPS